ncbi:sugar ABC transporter ATP-binding protein [Fusibacter ferrireducens]|uniref:Autoinducer 2 import ATP-binding protein LsrA n=1 Tax=Fusibacter ferrireducens TaxID=2785058 RepID=A0ABR9ZUR0_9FIRM|nr:sugar ABC transporter ATP-binding protein [Fusibacter ferrireducens]MBF4693319.1 sugar ABC transporter ATP-binding protein [Fusibacter ferrireducens]
MSANKSLMKLHEIYKSFGDNAVLKGASLELSEGEIVAIIGGNGAGKSTLMKILMGIYPLDRGEIFIEGEKVNMNSPSVALEKGIYLVPQEPLLFPNMTVEENVVIGFNENKNVLSGKLRELIKQLGWDISLSRKAATLSIAEQQLVEILRGLLREAKILILDEPTSTLTFNEIQSFFELMMDLKKKGIGMLYITHRLTEVFEVASHVVILRDGEITVSGPVANFTKEMLIKGLMPDNMVHAKTNSEVCTVDYTKQPVLKLDALTGYGFSDVSFSVYEGEILGLAGVVGSGRTELAEAIFGKGEVLSGDIELLGKSIRGLDTNEIVEKGLNYVPEDRHLNGIFAMADVRLNTTSSILSRLSKVFINRKQEKAVTQKYIDDFRIKVTGQDQTLKSLSGGNQQKVVIGRTLSSNPKVIILDEPTRGIDAGARGDVYKIIYQLKKLGLAILLISSDFEEINELADRAEVMYHGTNNVVLSKAEITLDALTQAAFGC